MNIDMQALIEEMSALMVKIKSGTATLGELEAFAAAASQLNERAIVLRYKAYEAKVFGAPEAATTMPVAAPVMEPVDPEPPTTPAATEQEPVADEQEADNISFDLFGESDAPPFDLFSEDEAPVAATVETPSTALTPEETHVERVAELVAESQVIAAIVQDEQRTTGEPVLTPDPEVVSELEPVAEEPEVIADEVPVAEAEIPVQAPEIQAMPVAGNEHPVYSRLTAEDNSLAARLMAVRLESLKGAFGFNERLQIIQELFNGSNEAFTQAIEHIDTVSSKSEARLLVSGYAHRFEWDKDSNLALEFIQKVERRFA